MLNKKYYLGSLYPSIYFTSQEAKCMYYALHGLNNEETADAMHLSHRTVGRYFELMRQKVNATHKKWLIEKVRKTDFIQHMGELLALEQKQKMRQSEKREASEGVGVAL